MVAPKKGIYQPDNKKVRAYKQYDMYKSHVYVVKDK